MLAQTSSPGGKLFLFVQAIPTPVIVSHLLCSTLSPDKGRTIPTVTDNLFSSGTISENVLGISFEPDSTGTQTNGELTFGVCTFTYLNPELEF